MEIQEWISKDQWCVYKHTSPSGKSYVGMTINTINRWKNGKGYKSQKVFWKAIQKYGWENFSHDIVAIGLSFEEAQQKEISLIKELDSTNPKHGYNMTKGGDYVPLSFHTPESIEKTRKTKKAKLEAGFHTAKYGTKMSEEQKKKISEARKGKYAGKNHPMYGTHPSEETRRRMSESAKRKVITDEHRRNLSRALKGKYAGEKCPFYGKKLPPERVDRMRHTSKNIPVLQYDKDGNLLGEWESMAIAGRALHIFLGDISRCCNGKRKTAGGFLWKRKNPTHNPPACNNQPSLSNK